MCCYIALKAILSMDNYVFLNSYTIILYYIILNCQHQQWIGGAETPGRPVWPLNDAFTSKKRLEGWACDTWGYLHTRTGTYNSVFRFYLWFFTSRKKWRPPRTTSFNTCQASRVLSKNHQEHHFTNTSTTHHPLSPPVTSLFTLTLRRSIPLPFVPPFAHQGSVTFTRTAFTPRSSVLSGYWVLGVVLIDYCNVIDCDWLNDPMVFVFSCPFCLIKTSIQLVLT